MCIFRTTQWRNNDVIVSLFRGADGRGTDSPTFTNCWLGAGVSSSFNHDVIDRHSERASEQQIVSLHCSPGQRTLYFRSTLTLSSIAEMLLLRKLRSRGRTTASTNFDKLDKAKQSKAKEV